MHETMVTHLISKYIYRYLTLTHYTVLTAGNDESVGRF